MADRVDVGLDAQRPPFSQVPLDEGHLHVGARAEDPGADRLVRPRGWRPNTADLMGAPDANVVGHEGLEEALGPARIVEHQRARDLDLAHGQLPQ